MKVFIAICILIMGVVLAVVESLILPFLALLAVYTLVSAVIALWQESSK